MAKAFPLVGALLVLAACHGCSFDNHYEIQGIIRSRIDGTPLAGVRIAHSRWHGEGDSATTDEEGRFLLRLAVINEDADRLSRDSLIVSGDGFIAKEVSLDLLAGIRSDNRFLPLRIYMLTYLTPEDGPDAPSERWRPE